MTMQTIHVDGAEGDCDVEAERELEAAAERAATHGYEPTPEVRALGAIFGKAVSHDSACQLWDARLYEDLVQGEKDDANKNALRGEIVELCAAIAPAALRRVSGLDVLAGVIARHLDDLEDMGDDAFDAFFRPIFEESGVGARYVSDWAETLKARGNL